MMMTILELTHKILWDAISSISAQVVIKSGLGYLREKGSTIYSTVE